VTLIERLEALTEPDCQIADEVLIACGWTVDTEDHEGVIWKDDKYNLIASGDVIPLADLNIAMGLIPRPLDKFVCILKRSNGRFLVQIGNQAVETAHCGEAINPAIALCIAALKARGVK
jgi:hypothetical protein